MKDKQTPITIEKEDNFKTIFSKYGCIGSEKQKSFLNYIGDLNGDLDIDNGTLSFGKDINFNIQILGFYSEEFNQWSWGWDNENIGFNEDLIKKSQELKEIGEKYSINELTTPSYEIDFDDCYALAMLATSLLNQSAYFIATIEDLDIFVLIDSDEIPVDNSTENFRYTYHDFQKNFDVFPRIAFEGYTKAKGHFYKERDDFVLAKIGEDRVIVGFSDKNRVTNIQILTVD